MLKLRLCILTGSKIEQKMCDNKDFSVHKSKNSEMTLRWEESIWITKSALHDLIWIKMKKMQN